MVRTEQVSNDQRDDDPNPAKLEMVFKSRMFKTMDIQKTWLPQFKDRPIITGRKFERSFHLKYYPKMLALMDALGWIGLRPLPKNMYTNLITGIANAKECIFINKPSQLDQYVSKKCVNDIIAKNKAIGVTQMKELRKEFKLFHRCIAYNIIPKEGHYNQVTTMDAFIIYKVAMDEPLNLNYIILKEMADVKNHSSPALPYGALLTKIFNHFRVKHSGQRNQYISKGFSITMIKRGTSIDSTEEENEEEGDKETSRHAMDVEGNLEVLPPQTEETYVDPSTQNLQLQWQDEEKMQGKVPVQEEYHMHEGHPS
ncbi:hypothetical protein Acr_29g0006300 [Actinidia rufa]|uniref:Uncharacterized protein n=1 Tax=Actinidia rufa TaxID=165716 RepID=A0A7J0HEI8_9ERIC|nr:hypothetical protein Acr_29g0006300 [Actinidia rufa]